MKNKHYSLLLFASLALFWGSIQNAYSQAFITTWQTTDGQITIPTVITETYNYNLTWTNLVTNATGTLTNQTGDALITGLTNGETYRIEITGTFPRILGDQVVFNTKLKTIEQWGNIAWTSMQSAFQGCTELTYNATDAPNLSGVTSMQAMFRNCPAFNATNLNNWNTSTIVDMQLMFANCPAFNGDISGWNTSNVTTMRSMFIGENSVLPPLPAVTFNQDISGWNTSNVTDMFGMFYKATAFSQNLSTWNVANVTNMILMFDDSGMSPTNYDNTLISWASQAVQMNVPLGAMGRQYCLAEEARNTLINTKGWTITGDSPNCVETFTTTWQTTDGTITIPTTGTGYLYNLKWTNLTTLATGTLTNQTGSVTLTGLTNGEMYEINIAGVFPRIYFNNGSEKNKIRTLKRWGNIAWASMAQAFKGCTFLTYTATDVPNLSGVTNLQEMWADCSSFNAANLSGWNTATITNMQQLFSNCSVFNGTLNTWNTANVTNMISTFAGAVLFNQPIGTWNTSQVTNMSNMFNIAQAFNQNISTWNVAQVTNMQDMFLDANAFNQNISTWNTANVTNMQGVFYEANVFNQNLGAWNVANVTNMAFMLDNCGISPTNYDNTLIGWASQAVQMNVPLGATGRQYCQAQTARNTLTATKGWTITDDALTCAFITTWQTTDGQITIPTTGTGYNYNVRWENLTTMATGTLTNQTGNATLTGLINGQTYRIYITGTLPRIYFNNGSEVVKIKTLTQWGNIAWTSMEKAFFGCGFLTYGATDAPNLSGVTSMQDMFQGCTAFNATNLNSWNTSTITNMQLLFYGCLNFNGNLSAWNTNQVTNMAGMFADCQSFNQNIGGWNTNNVTDMAGMFFGANSFNQNIGGWNTNNVTDMAGMFFRANSFNQNISTWNTRNVTNMRYMFFNASAFNQNIGGWNTNNVTDMAGMFFRANSFNQNISTWNTSNVTNMRDMFNLATAFNQNISGWNTSNVTDMSYMFDNATAFNQHLGGWNVANVTNTEGMLSYSGMSATNYDNTLIGWASQAVQHGVLLEAYNLQYCAGASARNTLITTKGWTIAGDGYRCISTTRGNMMTFDGSTSYATAPYSATLNPSTFTVEAWVKVHSAWANNFRGVISSRENTNGYGYTFYAGSNLTNTWHFWLGYADGSQQINTGVPVVQDAWTHLVASYNGTDLKVYIDGVLVSNTTPVTPPHLNNAQPLFVGSGNNTGLPDFFTACSIDELRVWSAERDLTQIRANMHLTLAGNEANLNAYYQFNETTGNVIEGINALHLTPAGTTSRPVSTLSVGKGVSKTINVTSAGGGIEVDLSTTNFEINLPEASDIPFDDVVVTQITAETPYNNLPATAQTTSCYWIVRNFGDNDGLVMSYIKVKIPNSNVISATDEATPANFALYKRATNSTGAWTSVGNANSANNTTKEINFPFPTVDSFSEFIVGSGSSPLPITLLGLKGERVEGWKGEMTEEVKLTWETASEINNKGFEVEMSENGRDYTKITFIEGKGNSTTVSSYQLSVSNPSDGYYRLRQVDFDGTFSYSPVVFVEGLVGKVIVYPNPNNGTFTISLGKEKLDSPAHLLNAQGKEVWRSVQTEVRTTGLPTGMYFLHTIVAGKVQVTKIIIEK